MLHAPPTATSPAHKLSATKPSLDSRPYGRASRRVWGPDYTKPYPYMFYKKKSSYTCPFTSRSNLFAGGMGLVSWEDREGGETLPVAGMWSALAPGLFLGCKVMTIDKIVIVSRASSDTVFG